MPESMEQNQSIGSEDQSVFATGRLFQTLANDPKYRKKVLGLIKEVSPETVIPELDLQDQIMRNVEERVKPNDDHFSKINSRFDNLERHLTRENFKSTNNLSDAELVEVEQLAKTTGIGDGRTAVEFWKYRQQLGNPRGTRAKNPGTAEYLSKLSKTDPRNAKSLKALATEEALRVLGSNSR